MGNGLNIPVPPNMSDGGTQQAKSAGDWKCRSKDVGYLVGKSASVCLRSYGTLSSLSDGDWLMLYCQEKLLNVECKVTVPKPTHVGG